MSNRIEFFQPSQKGLSLPCATVSILLDGSLCPYLEVVEIVRSGWPEFSCARLVYNPAAYPQSNPGFIEEIEAELAPGKTVCIQQFYNGTSPASSAFSLPIFIGQIEGVESVFAPDGEKVEITAKDFGANLK